MPLSKKRNRDRMRKSRLHGNIAHRIVQPKSAMAYGDDPWGGVPHTKPISIELDADGNPIPMY